MKKIIALTIGLLSLGSSIYAATPKVTSTASAILSPSINQIDNLKERLATKVAQLQQVERKAIVGTVKAVSISTITVETKTSDVKIELTDNIKVFQTIKGKRTELQTSDIAKGDLVVVFGQYDATLDLLKANVIIIQDPLPTRVSGLIMDVDRKNFTVTIQTSEGKTFVIDIEKGTAMFARDQTGVIKGGFTKVQTGEVAHIVGTVEPKKDNYISALRFLDIGFINGTPTPTLTETPVATPSATTKTTPKPTPKPTVKPIPTATPAQ